ncbi:MAG: EAL domain-containing protein [Xanthomonadales bacterium]|nr:EAL domain-containing protein [Xanthomonadales bacterium]
MGAIVAGTLALLERDGRALIAQSEASLERLGRHALEERADQLTATLAEALANPLYHLDLKAIRDLARSALSRPDVHRASGCSTARACCSTTAPTPSPPSASGWWMRSPRRSWPGRRPPRRGTKAGLVWVRGVRLGDTLLGGIRVELGETAFSRAVADSGAALAQHSRAGARAPARGGARRSRRPRGTGPGGAAVGVAAAGGADPAARRARPLGRAGSARSADGGSRPPGELGILADAFEAMRLGIERQQEAIRRLAVTDQLSGLPNRLGFVERAERLLAASAARGEPLALLMIDLDGFKRINDSHGHETGDAVLAECARRIVREVETLAAGGAAEGFAARLGGDEFVAVVAGEDAPLVATRLAERLRDAIATPFAVGERLLLLGASIGIAIQPDDAASLRELLRCADLAMYEAKAAGKNGVRRYSLRLRLAAEGRIGLESELAAAFERGELELYFQPIVRLRDRTLLGAEALLRWNHPTRGLLPADQFWGVVEDSVILRRVAPWILERACRAARDWNARPGLPAPFVAVNVSAWQILSGELAGQVGAAIAASGLEPSRLHLEISERGLIADEPRLHGQFRSLRELGVGVWLDDFGTGYSGLARLRQLPLDGVKIDRSFIVDLLADDDDRGITEAIVAMTRALDLGVIAEGVESEGHVLALLERGCELGQGYWLARPRPQAGMLALLGADAR